MSSDFVLANASVGSPQKMFFVIIKLHVWDQSIPEAYVLIIKTNTLGSRLAGSMGLELVSSDDMSMTHGRPPRSPNSDQVVAFKCNLQLVSHNPRPLQRVEQLRCICSSDRQGK